MKHPYSLFSRFIARILLASLCLQSCSGLYNLPINAIEPSEPIQELNNPDPFGQLTGKQLISKEGYAVTILETKKEDQLQAKVIENIGSLSRTHHLPVYIEEGINVVKLTSLNETEQKGLIHVVLLKDRRESYVYIGHTGLMGGMKRNDKGKEKIEEPKEKEIEQTVQNDLEAYQLLYNLAIIEKEAEAQFKLGQRAHELWKREGQRESDYKEAIRWLEEAANQAHEGAIRLLNELRQPMVMEEGAQKKQKERNFKGIEEKEQKTLEVKRRRTVSREENKKEEEEQTNLEHKYRRSLLGNNATPLLFNTRNNSFPSLSSISTSNPSSTFGSSSFNTNVPFSLISSSNRRWLASLATSQLDFDIKTEHYSSALHDAIINCDINKVEGLVNSDIDINIMDDNGDPLLHLAIEQVNILLNKQLIDLGLEIDFKNIDCNTLLYLTVTTVKKYYTEKIKEIIELLIEKGVNVNNKDNNGNTPLYVASKENNLELAQLLIEHGADVNAKNVGACPPLHGAAQGGYLELVKLLLEHGADVNAGRNPFICREDDISLRRRLLSSLAISSSFIFSPFRAMLASAPLHKAVLNGHLEVAKLLIEKDARVNAKDEYGKTPLHHAVEGNYLEIVKLLLERGAEVNVQGNYGHSPLLIAAQGGYLEIAKLLLERGAEVNAEDSYNSPLHKAIEGGYLEIVKLLLEKGADLDIKDNQGLTPLQLAIKKNYTALVKLLTQK